MTSQGTSIGAEPALAQSEAPASQTKCVRLTRDKAARWLSELNSLALPDAKLPSGVEQLRNRLEDECWLARWKREEVILEFCPTMVADVLDELLEIIRSNQLNESTRVLEEIIRDLSASSLGNSKKI